MTDIAEAARALLRTLDEMKTTLEAVHAAAREIERHAQAAPAALSVADPSPSAGSADDIGGWYLAIEEDVEGALSFCDGLAIIGGQVRDPEGGAVAAIADAAGAKLRRVRERGLGALARRRDGKLAATAAR